MDEIVNVMRREPVALWLQRSSECVTRYHKWTGGDRRITYKWLEQVHLHFSASHLVCFYPNQKLNAPCQSSSNHADDQCGELR